MSNLDNTAGLVDVLLINSPYTEVHAPFTTIPFQYINQNEKHHCRLLIIQLINPVKNYYF